jgi:hypothetical protein
VGPAADDDDVVAVLELGPRPPHATDAENILHEAVTPSRASAMTSAT